MVKYLTMFRVRFSFSHAVRVGLVFLCVGSGFWAYGAAIVSDTFDLGSSRTTGLSLGGQSPETGEKRPWVSNALFLAKGGVTIPADGVTADAQVEIPQPTSPIVLKADLSPADSGWIALTLLANPSIANVFDPKGSNLFVTLSPTGGWQLLGAGGTVSYGSGTLAGFVATRSYTVSLQYTPESSTSGKATVFIDRARVLSDVAVKVPSTIGAAGFVIFSDPARPSKSGAAFLRNFEVSSQAAAADLFFSSLFSDHAVLQKADKVPIWGQAKPGEAVTVTLKPGTAQASTVADAAGKWSVDLDLHDVGSGPFELAAQGKSRVVAEDVVVGEVWVCSGQSNMEFTLASAVNAKEEIPVSANPLLRQFKVAYQPSPVPLNDVSGEWVVASPETSAEFTAIGYFFGKKLAKELGRPVGLINSSVGATPLETWASSEALASDADLKEGAQKSQQLFTSFGNYIHSYQALVTQTGRQDHTAGNIAQFALPADSETGWKSIVLPSSSDVSEAGAVWFRRKVSIPAGTPGIGSYITVQLGTISPSAQVQVFWNGAKVGEAGIASPSNESFDFSSSLIRPDNILAVRIYNPTSGTGIVPGTAPFQAGPIPLAGQWDTKVEFELPPLDASTLASLPPVPATHPSERITASYLFNGMIHPLIPYGIRGVIWYQGEGNAGRAYQYRKAFPLLIQDWRARWGEGNFPFYFCQLANYMARNPQPADSCWAELREAQTRTLSLPNTGEAILIDLGEEADIHPKHKEEAADRLARVALALSYGKNIAYAGPVYDSMSVEGSKIRIRFTHTDGGLMAKPMPKVYQPKTLDPQTVPLVRNSPNSELEGFAICGPDHQWKWANAAIDNGTVVVWADSVPAPVAVRYAWADDPFCNLYNSENLPAAPFRTDDFTALTRDTKF
jgi:sialate O-acetylesterase